MASHNMTKEKWIELFSEIGLTEEQMHTWHRAFEKRYPDEHQAFLEWLNIPADDISMIRTESSS